MIDRLGGHGEEDEQQHAVDSVLAQLCEDYWRVELQSMGFAQPRQQVALARSRARALQTLLVCSDRQMASILTAEPRLLLEASEESVLRAILTLRKFFPRTDVASMLYEAPQLILEEELALLVESTLSDLQTLGALPLPFAELLVQEEPTIVLNASVRRLEELREAWEAFGKEYLDATRTGNRRGGEQSTLARDASAIHAHELDVYWQRWFCNTFVNYY